MNSKLSIFTMIYNDYELLRQFVESIFNNLDPTSWEQIIILDDYSKTTGKLREYEIYLENTYPDKIKIIKFDEYRRINYYSDRLFQEKRITKMFDYREFNSNEPNIGIVRGFHMGVKQVTTEFVLFSHADTFFTKKAYNMLNEMKELFNSHPKCMAMGQLWGCDAEIATKEYDKTFEFFYLRDGHNVPHGGLVASIFGAFRTKIFDKYCIAASDRPGNTFTHISRELLKDGYTIINYPSFTRLQLIHLGRAIVRRINHPEDKDIGFTFCKDIVNIGGLNGPRRDNTIINRMYGRGFINMSNKEYMKYLNTTYSKPFNQIQPTLSDDLIYTTD